MASAKSPARKSLPLSVHLSLWLIGVAIFPLLLALLINAIPSRTSLINQASALMLTDAKAHATLIDTYLRNKEAIAASLSNDPSVQLYLQHPKSFSQAQLALFVHDGLALEQSLYPEVTLIEYFTPRGELLLHFSIYGTQPHLHGTTLVPDEYLQGVLQGQQFFSAVSYDSRTHISSVELYTPVFASATSRQVVGFLRNTLKLDTIWTIVLSEKGANGSGSYAFLLDQNGVRIVDPDPHTLFTAIAPPSLQAQQQMQVQGFYGLTTQKIPVVDDQILQRIQDQNHPPTWFQEVPADLHDSFQVNWQRLTTVPWTYFVLTPVNIVEAVANQQMLILSLIALLVLIPVAVIGWFVGRRISTPILRSTDALVKSSAILNRLAEVAENAASEQILIVDSSQVGLKSVEYYTKASKKAIWQLINLGKDLPLRSHTGQQAFQQDIHVIVGIGEYLKKAVDYQDESNKKVSTAIKVTDGVASQLASEARSTKAVADELDRTVEQLRGIVGDA